MTTHRIASLVVAVTLMGSISLHAHDMWIEPTTFQPETGAIVGAKLRVGQDMIGDPIPRSSALINEFIVQDDESRRPLIGRDGSDPAGLLRVAVPGLLVVGYRSNPSTVEMTGEKFTQYLKDEGLDQILALRASRGQTANGVKEMFSREAKSLIQSGPASAATGDRTLGFPLELVAEKNPYALGAGQALPVRLTYESRPLAGALVVAINKDDPSQKLSARSDKDGRVRLTLPRRGMWLIKAVHMIPAAQGSQAEWESFWASLTFAL